ncbi:hypothetical protein ASG56_12405 [Rhodococcus sp. Leaf7]|uniref:hypothetical protein n=1 Tax=unclassified Rhodococcus (in: high G+C Gram-positive bacteria) TaxID=192944 RepID=UPI0006F5830C|nr:MULTISPECIES: hypothetical protein [unclassified Rhodococcus (in: high G+C Gram-positive bacteria)]KQU04193.1 hypothetical protein ASG56_12405 [Rhodococcus sp. Leaf7]KQU40378.1 hypothetical protein ASG64_12400 [Rhodococcus sp. Leaf247]
MSDENNDGAADTGQVSVAELLARNGAKVGTQAGGGRRRRGMAGGISVAELTGEIPIVRPVENAAPEAEAPEDAAPEAEAPQDTAPEADEPAVAPDEPAADEHDTDEHVRDERPEPARPAPAQAVRPSRPTPAFGPARQVRPEPALFSGAPSVAVDKLRADTRDRADDARPVDPQPVDPRPVEADDEVTSENDVVDTANAETTIVPAIDIDRTDHETDHEDPETKAETEDAPAAPAKGRSPVRQWLSLLGQGVVAIVLGALLFKGFERLWEMLPWVALVLAFFVIVGLVAVVRVLRRTDDIVSILLAVVVGGFVTLGPLAFMLSTT